MMNEPTDSARRFSTDGEPPTWVDTHCHLEDFLGHGNWPQVRANAQAAGVRQYVSVGTRPEDWAAYRALAAAHPGEVFYAAGIHPQEAAEGFEGALATLEGYFLGENPPVAVGEAGLDYYRLPKEAEAARRTQALQKEIFKAQIRIGLRFRKPLVVHARDAFADTMALLESEGADWTKVVFHCFAEGPEGMRLLKERGAFGSFTGVLTYKNADKTRAACLEQGMERLMLETDCPYLTPVPLRGKPNEPAYLTHTGAFAAGLFQTDLETLAAATTARARAFYGLNERY